MGELIITTLAERPELLDRVYDLVDVWPEFIGHDPVANMLFHQITVTHPAYSLIATEGDRVVARGRSVPFAFPAEDRPELPDSGWDRVMIWGMADHRDGVRPTAASALEIVIAKDRLGQGLSYPMLDAMRAAVRAQGIETLYAPVRPNGKRDPGQPMADYIRETRDDGLPVDPWLRAHVRVGGRIVKVAPTSLVIPGSLAEWRRWTGLPFDEPGNIHVPGALTPVRCYPEQDQAVYVEPNVWVEHKL